MARSRTTISCLSAIGSDFVMDASAISGTVRAEAESHAPWRPPHLFARPSIDCGWPGGETYTGAR
eukprot:4843706-Lingulodinium_polyedra.AAC.1